MNYLKEIFQHGIIHTVQQEEKPKYKKMEKYDPSIEICLNCKKKICRGCSKKFTKKRKVM